MGLKEKEQLHYYLSTCYINGKMDLQIVANDMLMIINHSPPPKCIVAFMETQNDVNA